MNAQPDQSGAVSGAVRTFVGVMTGSSGPDGTSVLHPLAHIRIMPAGRQGRPRIVLDQNAEALVAGLARGAGKLPGTPDEAQIVVEGIDHNIATARVQLGPAKVHLHLALMDGQWRVVTVLNWRAVP